MRIQGSWCFAKTFLKENNGGMAPPGGARMRDTLSSSTSTNGKRLFVTVGTTSFDSLIRALDDANVVSLLKRLGFTSVVVQFGRGEVDRHGLRHSRSQPGLQVDAFDFKPTLQDDMRQADLVITHAGAGSIFECLNLHVPCLVVVNETLMGNHQTELANALQERKHLKWCVPKDILKALKSFDASKLIPYDGGDPDGVRRKLDDLLG